MVLSGTEETISRVVETYRPMLLGLAWIRLEDPADAEDIVHEAFLRLLTTHPVFKDAKHEKTWLISILLHRAVDFRKAAARKNVPLEDHFQAVEPEADSGLRAAVLALPEKYSAVVHLHYYEDSMIEIAKLLGVPAATVGTCMARSLEMFVNHTVYLAVYRAAVRRGFRSPACSPWRRMAPFP